MQPVYKLSEHGKASITINYFFFKSVSAAFVNNSTWKLESRFAVDKLLSCDVYSWQCTAVVIVKVAIFLITIIPELLRNLKSNICSCTSKVTMVRVGFKSRFLLHYLDVSLPATSSMWYKPKFSIIKFGIMVNLEN